jgi:hypothetical protein
MPKKPVAVSLRKPQAPADVDSFVGGASAPAPVRAVAGGPIESAADVEHGARAYREMTFYLPTDVARELSFYCMDRNCDANRVVADAVGKHVTGAAAETTAGPLASGWGVRLEALVGEVRGKLATLWALRRDLAD